MLIVWLIAQITLTLAQPLRSPPALTNISSPHLYSCKSCNVVIAHASSQPNQSPIVTSTCIPFTCDYYNTSALHGPTCATQVGELVTCDNTVFNIGGQGYLLCNCDGAVTISPDTFSQQNITFDLANVHPLHCTANPPSIPVPNSQQSTCDVTQTTRVCSYYTSAENVGFATCSPSPYDPTFPTLAYDRYGSQITCDGSTHSQNNASYVCRCDGTLTMSEVMPVFLQWSQGFKEPTPIILDCGFQNSRDVLVGFDTAMKQIQNTFIDLRPIINLNPTT